MNDRLMRFAFIAFKAILFGLMAWLVVNRLFLQNNFNGQWQFFIDNLQTNRWYLFVAAVLLMPVNWLLETWKWKLLLGTTTTWSNLFKSIVAGITVGFVTPGRTGEFIGRVLFLDNDNKTKVFYISSLGGFAQTAASLIVGIPFVFWWSDSVWLTEITTGAAAIYLLVYFRFDLLNRLISSVPFLQRYGLTITHADLPPVAAQLEALLLSTVRFTVYLGQYILLLSFFGLGSNYFALAAHSVVFLLAQSFSPLMPLLDISYRSGSALFVFKNFTNNNLAVLSAVLLVWLLNLVVPAVLGYIFIFRKNNFKLPALR